MALDTFLQGLLSLPSVSTARLSPDGRWVAFEWYRIHENSDVFVAPTDGSEPPKALTNTKEFTQLVSWVPNNRGVIVEEDHDGDEHTRLFRVDLDQPEQMVSLTEDRPSFFLRGGELSLDQKTLFYGANYDFQADKVIEPTWLYRHNLQNGDRLPIACPKKPAYMQVSLNLPGTHLLYDRKDRYPSGRQFYLVDIDGKEDQEILNFGDKVKTFARWFPDGQNILVLSESVDGKPQEHISLGVYHWPTKQMSWLIDDPNRMIESAWVSPDGTIVVDEIRAARHVCTYLDLEDRKEQTFATTQGNLIPLGKAIDGAWIALYSSSRSPTDLVRFSIEDSKPSLTSITRVWEHTNLNPEQLTPAEDFRWRSVDGKEIQGWLYRTPSNNTPSKKSPQAVIYIHGGPTYHSEDRLNPEIQYLVWRGFNLLDVNYRGSTGFGLRFRESIKEDGWGGREQADIATGAQALIQAGLAAPGRVGVTGTSYGGYSSWYLITHYPPETISAAAPICGMTDLVVDYETTRPDLRPYSEEMIGGRPDEVPEVYFQRSPINFVENIRGKVLIVQGAQDPNVTPENVHQVIQRLETHNTPYELLVFDDEGHGIAKPVNQAKLFEYLADFFNRAL